MSQNPLENQAPSKENDFVDAVKAFIIAVGFFMGIGVLAIVVEVMIMK
ncbi:MAG: YqzM family protein [Bacilli bacterium]